MGILAAVYAYSISLHEQIEPAFQNTALRVSSKLTTDSPKTNGPKMLQQGRKLVSGSVVVLHVREKLHWHSNANNRP